METNVSEEAASTEVISTSPSDSPPRKLLKSIRQRYGDDEEVQEICDEVIRMKSRINTLEKERTEAVEELKNVQLQKVEELKNVHLQKVEELKNVHLQKFEELKNKNLIGKIKYCNIYRKQIENFESIFAKNETFMSLKSFQECFGLMLQFYIKERAEGNRKTIDITPGKKSTIFREGFTRVEKWRLIGLWIFAGEIAPELEVVEKEFENFKDELEAIREFIRTSSTQLQLDYKEIQAINLFRPLHVLKEFFTRTLSIGHRTVQKAVMMDILADARAFNDAFQSCSKELKKVTDLVATPIDYVEIRVSVDSNAVDNEYLVVQCMDMMVTIGLKLAASIIPTTSS